MCVDFTDLNKACPKDSFPLPHIDQLIDATTGHELLSFLDAYSGYNQILMEEKDQEKTTFITHQGTYCYKVMPFRLKNMGATYQRLITKMFKNQLGKTMEVYIDDMLVKSKRKEDYIGHLKEAFDILRWYDMKLNSEKCAFGVSSGKFLGFLVSQRGIEVNPEQIKAIEGIPETLTSKKQEGQRDPVECRVRRCPEETKSVLVFATLTRQSIIRRVPHSLPSRIRSHGKCSSSPRKPSQMGHRTEQARYIIPTANLNKVASARRLCRRFQSRDTAEVEQEALHTTPEQSDLWVLYIDGASNAMGSGLGLVLEVPTGEVILQSLRCPEMTNNEAEYEAVIAGLKLALKYGARWVILRCHSQLVVNQVTGTFQIKEQRLQKYQTEIHKLLPEFDECRFDQIPRAQSKWSRQAGSVHMLVLENSTGPGHQVPVVFLPVVVHSFADFQTRPSQLKCIPCGSGFLSGSSQQKREAKGTHHCTSKKGSCFINVYNGLSKAGAVMVNSSMPSQTQRKTKIKQQPQNIRAKVVGH
uniref:RNase H type-1 domain-containing protein n=1 Tax=Nicotiana tabacum TaxID=4097 RepID=A0A1S4D0P9_TOBAC|nr:PREDICTED: uncharacterized protein LOC107824606 [Nicotiana tabacum]